MTGISFRQADPGIEVSVKPGMAQIVVACARELAGFVWAIATQQPLRNA
jgi:hypothetical protein